ncbi:MAG TPA: hypothetical protein PKE26_05255 [Kiritimatiellia bacterium]|nr:hypothetical protein [Kiritimatiellia bacterium]HMO98500.1 hypothetical protein [Kiritimatiellia bacterium]HMP95808.1 hypothetical protein [Kiritimatiellia bacterium]
MKPIHIKGLRVTPQLDHYTCGYCTARTIYRFYNLRPRDYGLRHYLGVDHQILPDSMPFREHVQGWMNQMEVDTLGVLPMDIFAVLYWDGFDTAVLADAFDGYSEELNQHLKRGHPAIGMALPPSGGQLHWVVISGMDDRGISVLDSCGYCDPLEKNRYRYVVPCELVDRVISGIITVSRLQTAGVRRMRDTDFYREYLRGARFGAACLGHQANHNAGGYVRKAIGMLTKKKKVSGTR